MEPLNSSDKKSGVPEEPTPDLLRDLQVQRNDTWRKELDNPYSLPSYQNEFDKPPNRNGDNSKAPWRHNWGEVAHDNGPWQAPEGGGARKQGDGAAAGGSQSSVPPEQLEILMGSQHPKTSVLGFLYTGGITGAAMSAGMYGLDSRLLAVPEAERSGMMKMWEKISPTAKALQHHSDAAKLARTTFSTTNQAHAIAQLELDAVANIPKTLFTIAEVEAKLGAMATQAAEIGTVQQRLTFFRSGLAGNTVAVKQVLGTSAEVAAGQKLFERGSAEAADLLNYAAKAEAHAAVTKTLYTVNTAMVAKESALKAFTERGVSEYHGSLGGTTFRGLAKGLGISAATLAAGYGADYALGQIFGYKPGTDDSGRFILDGVIVPSILLSGYQPKVRAAMAAVAFGLARVTDCYLGTMAGTEMSTLLRPNMLEAVGVTGCALAPIPGKYKALGIAGTLALGRGYNLFARATGLDGFHNSDEGTRATLMTSEMTAKAQAALPTRLSTEALASSITLDRQELRKQRILEHLELNR